MEDRYAVGIRGLDAAYRLRRYVRVILSEMLE